MFFKQILDLNTFSKNFAFVFRPTKEQQRITKKLFPKIALNHHIMEVRLRSIYLVTSFLITFLMCYYYSLELIYLFVKPLLKYQNIFMFTDLTEALYTTITHCLLTTTFVILPFIVYQIWCFLIPSSFLCERNKLTTICWCIIVFFFFRNFYKLFFCIT